MLICRVQTAMSLDLYLAYLRAAYHTCYYCAVVTDHLEELQRKCIKHVRKPLYKSPREETKTGEIDKDKKEDESSDKGAEKEKEPRKGSTESKDTKRNGMPHSISLSKVLMHQRRRPVAGMAGFKNCAVD